MLFSIAFAYLAVWLPQGVLPDDARYLWRKANISWRVHEKMASRDKDFRTVAQIDYDLRESLRDLVIRCVPLIRSQIEDLKGFVEANENSFDPVVQADVKWHRRHLAKFESCLRWYQGTFAISDRHPLVTPR